MAENTFVFEEQILNALLGQIIHHITVLKLVEQMLQKENAAAVVWKKINWRPMDFGAINKKLRELEQEKQTIIGTLERLRISKAVQSDWLRMMFDRFVLES